MVQGNTIRALQAYLHAAAVEKDTAKIARVISENNVQACWRTFRQFQWKVVLQASSPTTHVTVHFSGGMPKASQQLAAVCIVLQQKQHLI